ncbi:NAD(P)H-dependent oxidoreductase [Sphingomonas sp.]|uniref:NAD(P)H-dependent oxidoreductase n=1 Tax=Sphingomonas sp. TaxID=28214 RepID=UPI0025F00EA2|nr:NAD(P)H-dependent oxidoreductase [Sphingomonas sp.]
MDRILAINSSILGEGSVSRALVDDAVQGLLAAHPDAVVTLRDLGADPIPHLTPGTVAGVRAVAATEDELAARSLSDELIGELQQATVLVIGAPMYNFSIPSSLRAWFDHVLRPRVTFAYGESGPEGLLKGIRAIVIQSRGGLYSEGPAKDLDFQEPYLRQLLGFIGITDVAFVHAEKISRGPEARDAAITQARSQIVAAVARIGTGGTAAALPTAAPDDETVDFAGILDANLQRVFNERDAARRLEAIAELYADDAMFHERDRSVQGHAAIARVVSELIDGLLSDATFSAIRLGTGHHDLGRLQWRLGSPDGPAAVTGTDVVHIRNGRIQTIHVFLDQGEG